MIDLKLRSVDADDVPAAPSAPRRLAAAVALADRVMDRTALEAPPMPALARPSAPVRPARFTAPRQVPTPTTDLPLFMKGVVTSGAPAPPHADTPDDAAVDVPAAPRPLVVRRAPELVTRAAADTAPALLSASAAARRAHATALSASLAGDVDATARLKAAALDLAVLAVLNDAVLLLTLRQCDLSIAEMGRLPILPLFIFQSSLTLAYLLSFSVASGQTIGKMILGLRVVAHDGGADGNAPPTARQMSYRALLSVPSVLLLGLGFLPGLVGEGRAVHDRLTHTRVVRG
jgi:uncharacterized RDD family membrane protein YckC